MLLHVFEREVDCLTNLGAIRESKDRVRFTDDHWMLFTNVVDDCIGMFLDTVVKFLAVRHPHAPIVGMKMEESPTRSPPPREVSERRGFQPLARPQAASA